MFFLTWFDAANHAAWLKTSRSRLLCLGGLQSPWFCDHRWAAFCFLFLAGTSSFPVDMVIPWDSILSLNRINYYRPAHPSLSYLPSPDFTKPKVLVSVELFMLMRQTRGLIHPFQMKGSFPKSLFRFCHSLRTSLLLFCSVFFLFLFGTEMYILCYFFISTEWSENCNTSLISLAFLLILSLPPSLLALSLSFHSFTLYSSIHPSIQSSFHPPLQ